MDEYWDVVVVDGDPVKIIATDEAQLAQLRVLVSKRPQEVAEFVRKARADAGENEGGVTLWLDPQTLERAVPVPQDLL